MAIKAMMVGASRSGKTSILASMLGSYRNNINLFNELPIRDTTNYNSVNGEKDKKSLSCQVSEMKDMLRENNAGCANMPKLLGTQGTTEYSFEIDTNPMQLDRRFQGLPNIELDIIDIPGENFQADNNNIAYHNIIDEQAKNCQILIVAVDVPSMMYASAMKKDDYMQKVNCNVAVQDLISSLGNNLGANIPKLLIFAPIKCEYWTKGIDGHNIGEVYEEVQKTYNTQIELLKQKSKSKIMIMPLETIGGLIFDHHTDKKKMKILKYPSNERIEGSDNYEFEGKMSSRCEMAGEDLAILPNGNFYELDEEKDEMTEVPEKLPFAYSPGRPIPFTWYKAHGDSGYAPQNCDQLFLQLLKFSVQCVAVKSSYTIRGLVQDDFSIWAQIGIRCGGYRDSRQVKPLCIRLYNLKKNGYVTYNYKEIHNDFDKDNKSLSFNF